ncbi:class II aldolase/adducin family protein [Rhodovulum sulfidophilum]|uniref:class II aldolase/adducin family protein n=1 Tax=Rhodovulum sulfidophilum TaxID=35806 RepID=UPI001920ECB8|nr:class II aldolase/adducin family protein [Rhodovulum sulfidophilum]MBL3596460.1 class II aldolase/adducin family protein [Rhodovulum sulfidophilum]
MPDTAQTHDTSARREIIAACREMNHSGINQGTSGNISMRSGEGILVTPTSLPYDDMTPEDIVWIGFDGGVEGSRRPSSEWQFHRDIMAARPEVEAIVHAHPTACTTLSIMQKDIPPLHYMVAICGGHNVRCAPYATFGTKELSDHALAALEGRSACLLAHHGMIVTGSSLDQAMWRAVELETLAKQYLGCLSVGEPPLLSEQEIRNVLDRMAGYGHSD